MADIDDSLIRAIQGGLPLTPRPFARVAERMGTDEASVLEGVRRLQENGVIRRLGVVVRHRELGYIANAMVVWDAPDDEVRSIAARLTRDPAVTLCYRRPRRRPQWPYNLFCMIHGKDREEVRALLSRLRHAAGISDLAYCVLFSRRRFKQRGARYASPMHSPGASADG